MSANVNKPNCKRKFDTPRTPQENRKVSGTQNEQSQEAFRGENEPVHLGKIIAGGRKRLGWSQKTFADNSEYDEKTIWNVENGNTEKPQTICDLRDVLNIALKKRGEEPIPWPSLETNLELRETHEKHPVIAASRLSSRGRNAGYEHLIGRDNERKALDLAWDCNATEWQRVFNRHANKELKLTGPPITPRIVVFNAWAGIGKTSLVARWATDKLAQEKHSDITRYFDWPFYTQGTQHEGDTSGSTITASAEPFLNKALEDFGDSALAASNAKAWQKGERLAQLIGQQRALLILDGLESMQDAKSGELYDDGLRALLRGLAAHNHGLCLVTTRTHLPELAMWHHSTAPEWKLASLTNEASAALLTKLGVNGTNQKKRDLSSRVKGHALSLVLLGHYLKLAHHGYIRRVDRVDFKNVNEKEQGGHAFRVIAAYERWFEESKCNAELAILRLLGLFDRPATPDCLAALCDPPIPGLTDTIATLGYDEWNESVTRLAELNLVEEQPWEPRRILGYSKEEALKGGKLGPPKPFENSDRQIVFQHSLDTHPLIREFFAKRFDEMAAIPSKMAHLRLYEYLRSSVPYWPEELDGLQPLYQAIAHGCKASKQEQALNEVYHQRIRRGDKYYSWKELGAIGADLAALGCFFEKSWTIPSPKLCKASKDWLLAEVALYLRSSGQLKDALDLTRRSCDLAIQRDDWLEAAIRASNMSQISLILGDVTSAVKVGHKSIELSKKANNTFQQIVNLSTLANALFQEGKTTESLLQFGQAELLDKKRQSECPFLFSLRGFLYCELLLAEPERWAWNAYMDQYKNRGKIIRNSEMTQDHCGLLIKRCGEVLNRAKQTLELVSSNHWMLASGLDHLTIARALLYTDFLNRANTPGRSVRNVKSKKRTEANSMSVNSEVCSNLASAIDALKHSGEEVWIVASYLTSAWFRVTQGHSNMAKADLDEAQRIAKRGPMRLHLTDIHLHRARLFHEKEQLKQARDLIKRCGYWRRKQQLEDAEDAAKSW